MPDVSRQTFSYRDDTAIPRFDDSRALFVFDGLCVLCSRGASWAMRFDQGARFGFTSAQQPLGQALYRHYGVDPDESYLLITAGRAYTASRGYLEMCRILGGPWHVLRLGSILPERLRDWIYAAVARNRYRWFGKVEFCAMLTPDQRAKLL
jgi:predicted DCC family thiol-disulfide oxidoreductase YuxK